MFIFCKFIFLIFVKECLCKLTTIPNSTYNVTCGDAIDLPSITDYKDGLVFWQFQKNCIGTPIAVYKGSSVSDPNYYSTVPLNDFNYTLTIKKVDENVVGCYTCTDNNGIGDTATCNVSCYGATTFQTTLPNTANTSAQGNTTQASGTSATLSPSIIAGVVLSVIFVITVTATVIGIIIYRNVNDTNINKDTVDKVSSAPPANPEPISTLDSHYPFCTRCAIQPGPIATLISQVPVCNGCPIHPNPIVTPLPQVPVCNGCAIHPKPMVTPLSQVPVFNWCAIHPKPIVTPLPQVHVFKVAPFIRNQW